MNAEHVKKKTDLECLIHIHQSWTFCGSPEGAGASACVYSLVETAKANGLNPYKYLEFLLSRLPGSNTKTNPKVLDLMMPWDDLIQKTCKSE